MSLLSCKVYRQECKSNTRVKPVEFLHFVHEGETNDEDDFVPLSLFPVQQCRMKVVHTPGPITLTRQSRPFVGDDSTSLIYNGKDIILLVLAKSSNVSLFQNASIALFVDE